MKYRICIGLQSPDPFWKVILDHIGIFYEELDYELISPSHYSAVILNKEPDEIQKEKLTLYLAAGGAIIEMDRIRTFHYSGGYFSSTKKLYLNNSSQTAFQHIPFLDVTGRSFPARDSDIFDGLIRIKKVERGILAAFGLNLPHQISHKGYSRKRFYNPFAANPDEIVNNVSKHYVLQLFEALLKEVHFQRKLPFIKKWESPQKHPVFCFRIDSDFSDRASVDKLCDAAKKFSVPLTWFLHVQAHENWLPHFKTFTGQEIALHGYAHGTSNHVAEMKSNIQKGLSILQKAGIYPKGYCAPYGIWNKAHQKALRSFDFSYSSEFTYHYDGYPLQPADNSLPLQIPVHPICPGSLSRHEMSISQMITYFNYVLNNKLARFEPIAFYHHPLQKGLEVLEDIFKQVNARKLVKLSFSDYTAFWKTRASYQAEILCGEGGIELKLPKNQESLFIYTADSHERFSLHPAKDGFIPVTDSGIFNEFEYSKQYLPEPEQIVQMRKNNLDLIKTSLLDWKNRKKL